MRNVLANRPDLKRSQLERTRQLMDQHAGDCLVVDYEKHIPNLELPDADDRHVLAAAIESSSEAIVTWNLSDFPSEVVGKFNIEVIAPDDFLLRLIESDESLVIVSMKEHRDSLKNPPVSVHEYIESLKSQGLVRSAERVADKFV